MAPCVLTRCLGVLPPTVAGPQGHQSSSQARGEAAKVMEPPLLTQLAVLVCPCVCREVLAGTVVAGQIKDTKAAREVQALQDFMAMLGQVGCFVFADQQPASMSANTAC